MIKPKNPAPFSHLYGKKLRNPHLFEKCPMKGCDNCQCLLCGISLTPEQSEVCQKCYSENDFSYYSKEEIHEWFVTLQKMHSTTIS
jgi:hypothetical protein